MGSPIRRLWLRAAMITLMLAGGLVAASMSPADADDGTATAVRPAAAARLTPP